MKFNRGLHTIKAISFDLDDTLYDNRPIIKAAVEAQMAYLASLPLWPKESETYWHACRSEALTLEPGLDSDMTRWRLTALRLGLEKAGYDPQQALHHSQQAFAAFVDKRSQIQVSDEILAMLSRLAERYPLIAITNGNVEVDRFNLKNRFQFVLQAGPDGLAKPHPDMFIEAVRRLQIEPRHLLHVGDSLDSDIRGANDAGCMSLWLRGDVANSRYKGLPHAEIDDILELRHL